MKNSMAIWLILAIALVLTASILGYRRVNVERKAHAECIEDEQAVQAYDRINRWPLFNLLRRTIVGQLKTYQPEGILVDVGCGPGYLVGDIGKSFLHLRIMGIDIAEEMIQIARDKLSFLGFNERVEF